MLSHLCRALGVAAVLTAGAGCGLVPPLGARPPAAPSSAPSAPAPTAKPAETGAQNDTDPQSQPQAEAEGVYKLPKDACSVLNAADKARLGLHVFEKSTRDRKCWWSNTVSKTPPFHFRDLKVDYSSGFLGEEIGTVSYAKTDFARRRKNDFRQPALFASAPKVKGKIEGLGSSKAGQDYDEGYYVYFTYQIGEAKRGDARAVLRKGNILITIEATGADVPTKRVADGKPTGNATLQRMIDSVADKAIATIK